jgi:hypothetical protein
MAVNANCSLDHSTTELKNRLSNIFLLCFKVTDINYLGGVVNSLITYLARSSSVSKLALRKSGKKNSLRTRNIIASLNKIIIHRILPVVISLKPS